MHGIHDSVPLNAAGSPSERPFALVLRGIRRLNISIVRRDLLRIIRTSSE